MKLMDNCMMVHLHFFRNTICGDEKEMDIAVEYPPFDDEEYAEWKKDLYQTVYNVYNRYGYWDEIKITYAEYSKDEKIKQLCWEIIVEV